MIALLEVVLYLALLSYALGSIFYFWGNTPEKQKFLKIAFLLTSSGCIFNLLALIIRTLLTGRLPLSNGYEFLLTFTWITVFLYLIFEIKNRIHTVGGVIMLFAALLVSSVEVMIKGQLGIVTPLMPALKSPWLTIHVLTAALAYACFTLTAGLAIMQFFKTGKKARDKHIYRIAGSGFAMLTLSIVLGAIWAEQAWGAYWSWDPKETWALITWIIYALYLHLHQKRDWKGKNASIMVIAGYILVLFTFFGVNFLLPGLHSYAQV